MKYFIIALGLLLGSGAWAGGWENCVSSDAKTSVGNGQAICFAPVTGDLDSTLLYVPHCNGVTYRYNPDDTGSAATTTCYIRSCVKQTVSTDCCGIVENWQLTGDAASHRDVLYDDKSVWTYVDCTGDPVAETPRIIAICH